MNITFLIGNGFDLNLGMKTRYADFYEFYKNQPSDNESVKKLKENIIENYENWSDLELAIGDYTKNLNSLDELDIINDDLREALSKYLTDEENKYLVKEEGNFKHSLIRPEDFLSLADYSEIEKFKKSWISKDRNTNIITFNYTNSFENIIDSLNILELEKDSKLLGNDGNSKIFIHKPIHIHGLKDLDMVLGVNDASQLSNNDFINIPQILGTIVKPNVNVNLKHLKDNECKAILRNSNLIVLFGLSLGDSDKMWWEIIGNRLRDINCKLIIFWHGNKISGIHTQKISRIEEDIKNKFLHKTTLNEHEKVNIKRSIYFGYNTDIFNVKLIPRLFEKDYEIN